MIFMQFAALFVIYAGYLTVMVLLPVTIAAVLGVACVRAIMMRRYMTRSAALCVLRSHS